MNRAPGSILGSHGDEFDERNLLLQLALGLVSACRRLDGVLERHGKRGRGAGTMGETPEPPARPAAPAPGDASLVDFVLGLIAFRDRVMGSLASARRARESAPRPSPRPLDGILR